MMHLNFQLTNYDFVFGIIILISAILAMIRGGVAELISLSTWILALVVMRRYAGVIEGFMPAIISNNLLRALLSYILSFLVVALTLTILKKIFNKLIRSCGLSGLNYAIGAIFGLIRGLIISALILIVIEVFNIDPSHSWQHSWLSPIMVPTVQIIVNAIPERMKNINQELGAEASKLITH